MLESNKKIAKECVDALIKNDFNTIFNLSDKLKKCDKHDEIYIV